VFLNVFEWYYVHEKLKKSYNVIHDQLHF